MPATATRAPAARRATLIAGVRRRWAPARASTAASVSTARALAHPAPNASVTAAAAPAPVASTPWSTKARKRLSMQGSAVTA